MPRTAFRLTCLSIAITLLALSPLSAQLGIPRDQPPLKITAEMRAKVIEDLVEKIGEDYVLADVATKMQQAIRQRVKNKEYDEITTGQELAALLTRHLQEVSRDKHLNVWCSTKKLASPPAKKNNDPVRS
jgi:hypothetical protein